MPKKKLEITTDIHYIPETAISEHDLQKKCVARLRAHNFIVSCNDVFNAISFIPDIKKKAIYKRHIIAMGGEVGFPDTTILDRRGKTTFVEFKYGESGKLSPDQIACHNKLRSLGHTVLVWRTENECYEWILAQLKEMKEEADNGTSL